LIAVADYEEQDLLFALQLVKDVIVMHALNPCN